MIKAFQERKAGILAILAEQAGNDPKEDRYHVGYLAAANDLLNIEIEGIQEDD